MAEQMRVMNENNACLIQLLAAANPPPLAAPPIHDIEQSHHSYRSGDYSQNHNIDRVQRGQRRSPSPSRREGSSSSSESSKTLEAKGKEVGREGPLAKMIRPGPGIKIEDPNDKVVIMAMMEGLRPGPLFDSLSKNVPKTLSALQIKADKYIAAEELAEAKRRRRGKDDHKRKEPDTRRADYREEARNKSNRLMAGDIQTIHGGFGSGGCSNFSRKRHARSAHRQAKKEIYNLSSSFVDAHPPITFNNDDLRGLHLPHDDALVISTVITNFNIQRILIDNGSSTDILFILAFEQMRIRLDKLHPFHTLLLVGFGGNMTHPLGWIKLPITLGIEPHQTTVWQDFIVWNEESEKNVPITQGVLGSPPLLIVPITRKELFVYLSISPTAISDVLIREEDGVQKLVYYVSKVLMGAEAKYLKFEKLAYALMITTKNWACSETFRRFQLQELSIILQSTGPRMLEGRPAQTNRSKGPGQGRSKPLRHGDQTKAMTADGVMGRVRGSRRDPRKDDGGENITTGVKIRICWRLIEWNLIGVKYFTSPKGEEETALWLWTSLMEIAWRGSMLSVGLILPRSRGFRDKHPLGRLWATSSMMIRLPDEGETITSTRPGEVAFNEAAFLVGLRFPLHNTIRLILQFYNICPTQLVPNAWRSIACSMALWRVYKYSISLSEFRNLFSLNCNPKLDQGWLYFKARNKKVLLGGYPSNVKGWKSKFFFVSGDEWEIPEGTSREGAPRVSRTWGILDKHCNNPPRLLGDEPKVFEEIFRSVEKSGHFSVPVLLNSKSFGRVFGSPGSRASRTAGDNLPSGEVPSSSSDVGESKNPHEQAQRESPSRDDSIECLGSIRTNLRRLLPHIPDLTLLRWSGRKVLDPILDRFSNAPSSNSLSESCSDSSLPVELKSDAMSKRVSFKKIGEKLGKAAGASSGAPVPAKGKVDDGSKGKGVVIGPEGKKKATSSGKAPTPPAIASPHPREADKEKVEKLTLDQTATKLFHVIDQALVLGSSLAVRSREAGEQAFLQEGRAASMETEIARLQKVAADLEQQLAESRAREQQANDELAKAKSDRDSLSDKFKRSGVLVNELREALNKSKCNFADIISTLPSTLKALWSIKICWRSKTRPMRRMTRKKTGENEGGN
ncbi:hypothetical protein Acr_14g0001980 [Actinidia rufa]|uniref:Reverse transcriptase RNase H-like domain-containing protein n=1 Tax=Actinidia rufa TaxID=165716 RepID=A0A7J0FPB4_9ERIC|nr:hypothetical protein Acr_14g0001980 [Actinidia rufa]